MEKIRNFIENLSNGMGGMIWNFDDIEIQYIWNFIKQNDNKNFGYVENLKGIMFQFGFGVTVNGIEAEKCYLMAIKLNNSGAMNNLGMLYEKLNRPKEAEKYLLMAIKLNNSISMYNLGELYEKQNRISESIKYNVMYYTNIDNMNTLLEYISTLVDDYSTITQKYFEEREDPISQMCLCVIYWKIGEIEKMLDIYYNLEHKLKQSENDALKDILINNINAKKIVEYNLNKQIALRKQNIIECETVYTNITKNFKNTEIPISKIDSATLTNILKFAYEKK